MGQLGENLKASAQERVGFRPGNLSPVGRGQLGSGENRLTGGNRLVTNAGRPTSLRVTERAAQIPSGQVARARLEGLGVNTMSTGPGQEASAAGAPAAPPAEYADWVSRMLRIPAGNDTTLTPLGMIEQRSLRRAGTPDGIALCENPNSTTTTKLAVVQLDAERPKVMPVTYVPSENGVDDGFELRVEDPTRVGFFVSYDGRGQYSSSHPDFDPGLVRNATMGVGIEGVPKIHPLAYRNVPGSTPIEIGYDLTNAGAKRESEEQALARKRELATAEAAGLFGRHRFEPGHTRAMARVVTPNGQYGIVAKPNLFFEFNSFDTKENPGKDHPDLLGLQATMRIHVKPTE